MPKFKKIGGLHLGFRIWAKDGESLFAESTISMYTFFCWNSEFLLGKIAFGIQVVKEKKILGNLLCLCSVSHFDKEALVIIIVVCQVSFEPGRTRPWDERRRF